MLVKPSLYLLTTAMQHQIKERNPKGFQALLRAKLEKTEISLKEGKIKEYHPIKPHVPLLMLRPAKSIPFLCCQSTSEAECFH